MPACWHVKLSEAEKLSIIVTNIIVELIAAAIENGRIKIVPDVLVTGGGRRECR